ncbi:MAG: hypothetical protein ABI668_08915 [Sphingorhabdus sp.]
MTTRPLDFTEIWNDATALLKSNREIVLALAGVFFLLPALAAQFLLTPIEPISKPTPEQAVQMVQSWFAVNWYWFVLFLVVGMIGVLSFNILLLDAKKPTVGEALGQACALWPTLFMARLLVTCAVFLGALLLIVPGVYLAVKFILVEPVIGAENQRNPITAMQRSWELTKGKSLPIFGFLLIVAVVSIIAFFVISLIFNIAIVLLLPADIVPMLTELVSTVLQMGLSLLFLFLYAAIYRQVRLA